MKPSQSARTSRPHPSHFDPKLYGASGQRVASDGRMLTGRHSRLRPEDAEQLLFLEKLAKAAAKDLRDFLIAKGYASKHSQNRIVLMVRKGWRPVR